MSLQESGKRHGIQLQNFLSINPLPHILRYR